MSDEESKQKEARKKDQLSPYQKDLTRWFICGHFVNPKFGFLESGKVRKVITDECCRGILVIHLGHALKTEKTRKDGGRSRTRIFSLTR
jgi:hypothetical protein